MNSSGLVFHIQRFSVHDGPGIRTAVFLKGCAMDCFWCHNPEGRKPQAEMQVYPDRCIHCGACIPACPNGAHEMRDGKHEYVRERCTTSGECIAGCFSGALETAGRVMTVDEVMEDVLADRAFYESSGGGVTLSGGEPALQSSFARAILERCRVEGIHTAIETCGLCNWDSLAELLPATDLVMMDIKALTPDLHKHATGRSNDRILDNAMRLAATDVPIVFRTPVVTSVNDSEDEIGQIAGFVRSLADRRRAGRNAGADGPAIRYELLVFHKLGSQKYDALELPYGAAPLDPPSNDRMLELAAAARRYGINPRVR